MRNTFQIIDILLMTNGKQIALFADHLVHYYFRYNFCDNCCQVGSIVVTVQHSCQIRAVLHQEHVWLSLIISYKLKKKAYIFDKL